MSHPIPTASACECSTKDVAAEAEELPLACALGMLTPEQRLRQAALLKEHLQAVAQVREDEDGYSFRYGADLELFSRIAELVALEHRCCPFLDFALEWQGGDAAPWLHIRGGQRVKALVLEIFAPKRAAVP